MKPSRTDVLLGLLVFGVAVIVDGLANHGVEPKWAAAVTELPAALMIVWRRRRPLLTVAVVSLTVGLEAALGVPIDQPVAPTLALVICLYTVAFEEPLKLAVAGFLLIIPGLSVAAWHISGDATIKLGNLAFAAIIGGGAWVAGRLVRLRTQAAVRETRRADRLAMEKTTAVAEERGRIARELHDVLAHSVSVMVVQAGAAQEVMRRDPQHALGPLEAIQTTGRQALVEMTRLVGLLRDDHETARLSPQPGIADIGRLVAQLRDSGLEVNLRIDGEPTDLPPGVDLSAYRVLQEALTNCLKHAGDTPARVSICYLPDALHLEVVNDGPTGTSSYEGGHGLLGMKERIKLVGGTLETGPRHDGGFAVSATLPLVST